MMKVQMSEPISGAAAGVAGWKILGGLAGMGAIGAGLAAVVVMSMTRPTTDREWRVALISTVIGSICGGAAVVQHFGLDAWTQSLIGLVAMLGLVFACGLPAWAIVRWLFNYIAKHQDADIADVVKDVKEAL
jgi:hypothetical protein